MNEFDVVGKSVEKIDSLSLATGNARFTDDFRLENQLHLAILYSPHPHAEILDIDDSEARKMNGVVDILHYKNVEGVLHTTAGQGYPEPSPYDTVLFDRKVRFVGDRVALVAAEDKDIAGKAIKSIKVEYRILKPILDPEKALDKGAPRIHDGDEFTPIPVKYSPERNLAAEIEIGFGNLKKGFKEADFIVDEVYTTQFASHAAIEPHAALSYLDEQGRLVIITSTQVPFHVRRIVSMVLSIPVSRIRVIKPRIGGGFGGKQEVLLEPLVALVTLRNKRPARLVLEREEVFRSTRTRHPMRIRLKTGVGEDGRITTLKMDALLNSGAYGTHALTVLSNTGAKVLPLFNKIENVHFIGRSVYTNLPVGGAYRGYGATQGYFALNQQLDIITRKTNQDILKFLKDWHIREGETSDVFRALGEGKEGVSQIIKSCKLDECIDRGAKEINWYEKRDKKIRARGDRVKGVGVAIAMQGSGIPMVDMGSATMKMNEDGSFNLNIGATDLGTGSDTILAQIAAEVLKVPVEKIIVLSSDTDFTPFDVGAYASSTTYVSGGAVKKCAEKIKGQMLDVASGLLESKPEELIIADEKIFNKKKGKAVSFEEIAFHSLYRENQFQIQAEASHFGIESPPPFIAQFAEVEVDKRTGKVDVVKFVSAVDCGQPINPKLAEGQVEGAVINGISYALCEEYNFGSTANLLNCSFWDYKIYTTLDIPEMVTIIVESFEETGPFGAKSVGEIAINGPMPAIANAIYDATGVRLFDSPFTSEKVYNRMKEEGII
ncbi:molybdopterin-dependent oxidoreductase [candidate division WOR-3 bacterium]|nr:molybdopterin-dependent oxidoreductase [candidate division WOR-3 bacterium]